MEIKKTEVVIIYTVTLSTKEMADLHDLLMFAADHKHIQGVAEYTESESLLLETLLKETEAGSTSTEVK